LIVDPSGFWMTGGMLNSGKIGGLRTVLKEKFPRLFLISMCKDSLVSNLVDPVQITSGGCQSWNLGWRMEMFV